MNNASHRDRRVGGAEDEQTLFQQAQAKRVLWSIQVRSVQVTVVEKATATLKILYPPAPRPTTPPLLCYLKSYGVTSNGPPTHPYTLPALPLCTNRISRKNAKRCRPIV